MNRALFFLITAVILLSNAALAEEISMSGNWFGEVTTETGSRKIYTVRTLNGYYFSRHEYYHNGEMTRWFHNYGLWGTNDSTYWAEIIVFESDKNMKVLNDCDAPKFTYNVNSKQGNRVTYTSTRDNVTYTMEKRKHFAIDYLNQRPLRKSTAIRAINTYKSKCREKA